LLIIFCNNSELLTTNRFSWSSPYNGDGYIRYGGFIFVSPAGHQRDIL
jgi:hypothetical protein